MRLDGKVAIITGASSGIGAASAKAFAKAGAAVILSARSKERLATVLAEIEAEGNRAVAVRGDVRDEDVAARLVDTALSAFGRLDIGFNNAGALGAMGDAATLPSQDWRDTLDTNLTSAFFGAKHQLPPMIEAGAGTLIFTSSFVGHSIGFPGMAAYGASKAGLIGLTQCLAAEVGAKGIRVNALLPGGTKTPMAGDFSDDPSMEETIAGFHALKRMAEPDEIAQAALFLASDAASFMTGAAMVVDGGNSILKA